MRSMEYVRDYSRRRLGFLHPMVYYVIPLGNRIELMQHSYLNHKAVHNNDNTGTSQHGEHDHCYNANERMMMAMFMLTMTTPTAMANARTMPMLLMMRIV